MTWFCWLNFYFDAGLSKLDRIADARNKLQTFEVNKHFTFQEKGRVLKTKGRLIVQDLLTWLIKHRLRFHKSAMLVPRRVVVLKRFVL